MSENCRRSGKIYTIIFAFCFVTLCVAGVIIVEKYENAISEQIDTPTTRTELEKEASACWIARAHVDAMLHVYNAMRISRPDIPKWKC